MPKDPTPLHELRAELNDWTRRMTAAGEDWLTARAAGACTDEQERRYREAAQNVRRLERRIARRKP